MPHIILVQKLRVCWSKRSRSAPEATRRNAVPHALPFILETERRIINAVPVLLTYHSMHENTEFAPRLYTEELLPDGESVWLGSVRINMNEEVLTVHFNDACSQLKPHRFPFGKDIFSIQLDSWKRLRYNGRYRTWEESYYEEHILNIGFFDSMPEPEVFMEAPAAMHEMLDTLWA